MSISICRQVDATKKTSVGKNMVKIDCCCGKDMFYLSKEKTRNLKKKKTKKSKQRFQNGTVSGCCVLPKYTTYRRRRITVY